jgi:hypothetical protein
LARRAAGVKLQVEEIVRSLFSYGAGTVLLWEGEVRPDNVVRLSLPTQRLISEGLKRRDELLKLLAWLEDPRTRLQQVAAAKLSGTERVIFEAIDGREGFAGICRRAGVDPLSGARTVQLLRLLGAVDIVRQEETPGEERDREATHGEDDAVRECVRIHLKLMAELAAPIVAVEGVEGIRERLEGIVEEASRRFPQVLSGVEVGLGGALDPEDIIGRALRFPGDREGEVRLALGELVSYLEFELLNHPRVSEPEEFLECLEELRSSL